jgi:acetolactate synthase-1/2/3 large subunit
MKTKGGELVVRALEDEGVRWTFGIPGTHNTELYDALERSKSIEPILVTDEQSASFMADAVSRTSDTVGVANVVPGAGVTHCLSGVAEAFMDGVPLVVLTCGIRTDTGKAFQLHDVDQLAILRPITKAQLRPASPAELYSTVRRAFAIARAGTPGPVAVEVPANFYLLTHDVPEDAVRFERDGGPTPLASNEALAAAAKLLNEAERPALYVGYGARGAASLLPALAEKLAAPVVTTIQGKGVFPESHPLFVWNGFGAMAPEFARKVIDRCDAMLAIGVRFGEVGTGSYGLTPPKRLVHVDINRDVFDKNYKAELAVESDALLFVKGLTPLLETKPGDSDLVVEISQGRSKIAGERRAQRSAGKVTPALFFEALQAAAGPRTIYAADSGNGTFLAMEQLKLEEPGQYIGPIDYSCMGYSVPAAVGAKFANPDRDVVALAGDGALLMTGLELATASRYGVAPVVCVLRDGELGQIAQFQRMSLDRDTCSILHPFDLAAYAKATGCDYAAIENDEGLDGLKPAFETARKGRPVVVEVKIDYSFKTFFTLGVVKTNFWRLSWAERLRMLARVAGRKLAPAAPK